MLVNFGAWLKDFDGKPIQKSDTDPAPTTLGFLAVAALSSSQTLDATPADAHIARYKLALEIHASNGAIEIPVEKLAWIKELISKCYASPLITGQACLLLESGGRSDGS